MRTRGKVGIGCLVVFLLLIGAGAYFWLTREPPPIVVAAPGAGGSRVMLGEAPANFFPGKGESPRPAILLIGGSEGGLKEYRNIYARQLAAEGYSVLYPGYFETHENNRAFNLVPLETFHTALAWLRARADVDANRIAVVGHSKGGEAALLIASSDPRIAAVVAAMPSDVVWQGFDFSSMDMSKMSSSWTRGGRPLAYVPYILPAWHEWVTGGSGTLARMYGTSWDARADHPAAAIAIDRIAAPILLICGEKDMIWPSCSMARAAETRARDAEVLAYPNAGHWAFGPASGLSVGDRKYLGTMGGTIESEIAARRDQWPKVLAFLAQHLGQQ